MVVFTSLSFKTYIKNNHTGPWLVVCPVVDGNVMNAIDAGQVHPPGGGFHFPLMKHIDHL